MFPAPFSFSKCSPKLVCVLCTGAHYIQVNTVILVVVVTMLKENFFLVSFIQAKPEFLIGEIFLYLVALSS